MSLRIVWRSQWGARPFKQPPTPNPLTAESIAFLHHTETRAPANSREAEKAAVRAIEAYHMDHNGWSAIGYSFLIAPSGRVYQGRGFSRVGAGQAGANYGNVSIAFIGSYDTRQPPWAARRACIQLLREHFTGRYLGGHRDVNQTSCPGDALYTRTIPRIRFYTRLRQP
jgi:hypothetical protein